MKLFESLGLALLALVNRLGGKVPNHKPRALDWTLFVVIGLAALLSLADVVYRWGLLPDTVDIGFFSAITIYPIGGRLVTAILFLALFFGFGWRRRVWLYLLSTLFVAAKALDFDAMIMDSIESRDTLLQARPAEVGEIWPFVTLVSEVLVYLVAALVIFTATIQSNAYKKFRENLRGYLRALRISEILLWALLLVQGGLALLAWAILAIEPGFGVFATYPVLGRLIAFVVFLVVTAISISSRGLLLTVGVASYIIVRFGLDLLAVDLFGQQDRYLGGLRSSVYVSPIADFLAIISFLIPILLIWIAVISIASVVRRRGREKINAWVDDRRAAIYGAEDASTNVPTRVSILAVVSLITSLVFPILGLVLAYAARNDFVQAQPRKSGLDIAVAATIIGWFGLGVQLLFVSASLSATLLDGPEPFDLLFGFFSVVFGGGALTPLGADSFSEWFFDALVSNF